MSQRTDNRQRIFVSGEGESSHSDSPDTWWASHASWILPHVANPRGEEVTFFLDDDHFTVSSDGSACPITLRSASSDLGQVTDILLTYFVAWSGAWNKKDSSFHYELGGVPTISEMVSTIRDAFSLNISQTAQALRVERPTIYAWIRETSSPRSSNRDRIESLYELANWWQSQTDRPVGDYLMSRSQRGHSLFTLLCARRIDHQDVEQALWNALETIRTREISPPSVRDRAESVGIDVSRLPDQSEEIDTMTGRPMSSE